MIKRRVGGREEGTEGGKRKKEKEERKKRKETKKEGQLAESEEGVGWCWKFEEERKGMESSHG